MLVNNHCECGLFFISAATYATLPNTVRGMPIVLGADPKGKNFLYTNGKDVVIRDVQVGQRSEQPNLMWLHAA